MRFRLMKQVITSAILMFTILTLTHAEPVQTEMSLYTSQSLNAGLSIELVKKPSLSKSKLYTLAHYDQLNFDFGLTKSDNHFYFDYGFGERKKTPTKYWDELSKYMYNVSFKYNQLDTTNYTRGLEFGLTQYYGIEKKLFWGLHFGVSVSAINGRVVYLLENSDASKSDVDLRLEFFNKIMIYFKWI